DIEGEEQVVNQQVVSNPGHSPGAIPEFLHKHGVEVIIAGGMGMRAVGLFQQFNIQTLLGIDGIVDDVVAKLVKGELKGGESLCHPGAGKGYGIDKTVCDHTNDAE
ncbi:MAG: dinitrogenase iron-molybdenum cofactor, partial [Candidatus Omnitrophota bacterium]